jgi:uncharacterized protein YqhQ
MSNVYIKLGFDVIIFSFFYIYLCIHRCGLRIRMSQGQRWLMICSLTIIIPLLPIVAEIKRHLLKQEALHADETTLQVLKEPGKAARRIDRAHPLE